MIARFAALVAPMLFTCSSGLAATYVVDQAKGDDLAIGSEAAPFKTINRGARDLAAGDVLLIRRGAYRETVIVKARGTAAAPITIRAAPGERVVITGADTVSGWKRCTETIGAGNPHFNKIYYADIDWRPTTLWNASTLYHDKSARDLSRCPSEGYWSCTGATQDTLTDAKHLTQTRDVWANTLINIRFADGETTRRIVMSFDPATDTFQLNRNLPAGKDLAAGKLSYYLERRLPGLDRPDLWAWEQTGESTARVYYWPKGPVEGATIELPRWPKQLILDEAAYVTVEGLDMGYGMYQDADNCVVSVQASDAAKGVGEGIVIRNCSMHHHHRFGVFVRNCKAPKLINCLVHHNGWGVMLGGNADALVQGCEISHNTVDGLRDTYGGRGTVVRDCYVHHHWDSLAHPDNIQTHNDVKDLAVERCLLVCGGQSVMMASTDGVTFRECVVVGSAANMMICGHDSTINATFERNTFHMGAMQFIALAGGRGYRLSGNIMAHSGGSLFYAVPESATFEADNNLYWVAPGVDAGRPWRGKGSSFASLEALQAATPWETHSLFKDPQFKNAPLCVATLDRAKGGQSTLEKLYIKNASLFDAGDYVEVNFDGVVRTVKAVADGAITIDPPLKRLTTFVFVANWRDNADFTYDYSSPENAKYGSAINVPAFMKSDFDGDGERDVPPMEP